MRKDIFPGAPPLAAALAEATTRAVREAVGHHGSFSVALTGGSAAQQLYPLLAQTELPWEKVHIFFGDERCVPPDHLDSNFRLAHEALLSKVPLPPANIHRIHGEAEPVAAARECEAALRLHAPSGLDVVHLGMGPDGHVCSLFPGHALLQHQDGLVASLTDSPKPPPSRVTLTMPALMHARAHWFLVLGKSKDAAVRDALAGMGSAPATLLQAHPNIRWFLDQDAASLL